MKGKGTKMVATARSLPSREAKGLPLSEAKGLCHGFLSPNRGPRHTSRAVATQTLAHHALPAGEGTSVRGLPLAAWLKPGPRDHIFIRCGCRQAT